MGYLDILERSDLDSIKQIYVVIDDNGLGYFNHNGQLYEIKCEYNGYPVICELYYDLIDKKFSMKTYQSKFLKSCGKSLFIKSVSRITLMDSIELNIKGW